MIINLMIDSNDEFIIDSDGGLMITDSVMLIFMILITSTLSIIMRRIDDK